MTSRKVLFIFLVLTLVVIAFVVYFTQSASLPKDSALSEDDQNRIDLTTQSANEVNQDDVNAEMSNVGRYISYESKNLTAVQNVIFFAASWCPTCRSLDNELNSSKLQIPSNLTILKADFDNEKDLRRKYGVTIQHTLVLVDRDGDLIKKWNGSKNLSEILNELNK